MNIYLNEACFHEISEIEESLKWLSESLAQLEKQTVYTRLQTIQNWQATYDDLLDKYSRTYLKRIFMRLEESEPANFGFYYYHFTHQNYGLSISENISHTSLAIAAEKILQNQLAIVLNLPNSPYNYRPHIPILSSPYNAQEIDKLVNIPCFDTAKKANHYLFFQEKIKPYLQKQGQEVEAFSAAYQAFTDTFDFQNWQPKQLKNNQLIPNIAFPASSQPWIQKQLSTWKIEKGSTNDNITQYKLLGGLVAELHGYTLNERLSSHYQKYEIYEAGSGNYKLLISIDIENGGFEVIENSGTHIGVYGYNGKYLKHYTNQNDINSHSLPNIPKHLFLFP